MTDLYLGLGSNMGNREQLLLSAVDLLQKRIGTLLRLSAFYETEPWGFDSPHPFLNAVIRLHTALSPREVLLESQRIERELGRCRKSTDGIYADRPIDIDLLLYGHTVEETDYDLPDGTHHLSLPHPLMHQRLFVMEPLAEIAPDETHPVSGKTFASICNELKNTTRLITIFKKEW